LKNPASKGSLFKKYFLQKGFLLLENKLKSPKTSEFEGGKQVERGRDEGFMEELNRKRDRKANEKNREESEKNIFRRSKIAF